MYKENLVMYGNLGYHLVTPENIETGLVVMAHGYGANEYDLETLSNHLDPNKSYTWAFPAAPISLGSYAGMVSRSWFGIEPLVSSMPDKSIEQISCFPIPDFHPQVDLYVESLVALCEKAEKVVIAGFSQGGMMALHALPKLLEKLPNLKVSLCCISTAPVMIQSIEEYYSNHPQQFILLHGENDLVLPESGAEFLFRWLRKKGCHGKYFRHKGGHEVPNAVLPKLSSWLEGVLN